MKSFLKSSCKISINWPFFVIYALIIIKIVFPSSELESFYSDYRFVQCAGNEIFDTFFAINFPLESKGFCWFGAPTSPSVKIVFQTNSEDIEEQCKFIFKGLENEFVLQSDSKNEKKFYYPKNNTVVIVRLVETGKVTCNIEKAEDL